MGNSDCRLKTSKNSNRKYFHLALEPRSMKLLDVPDNYVSSFVTGSLGHQMRYSVETLEVELAKNGTPHVLQLWLEGDDKRNPSLWTLCADGTKVASGTGDFARERFYESAEAFRDLCREAVGAACLPALSEREYSLLSTARRISDISVTIEAVSA